jgi:hypothetical protein
MIGEVQISKTTMAAIALEVWRLHKNILWEVALNKERHWYLACRG